MTWSIVNIGSTFKSFWYSPTRGLKILETPSSREVITSQCSQLSAWLCNSSSRTQIIFYLLTILVLPIVLGFWSLYLASVCKGARIPKVRHHRKESDFFFVFWDLLPKRGTISCLEEGYSQWTLQIILFLKRKKLWQTICWCLPCLELHNLGIRPRGQIIQSWIFFF